MKSKKGISPILATLLLIVIAVAAITVTYAWIMTYMGNATDNAGVILYEGNVSFNNSTGTEQIIVDVGNSGTSSTKIVQLYVGNSTSTMIRTIDSSYTLNVDKIVSITVDYEWVSKDTYYFRVVPASGQALEFNAKAP